MQRTGITRYRSALNPYLSTLNAPFAWYEAAAALRADAPGGMDQAARLAIIELLLPERMTASGPMLSAALLDLIMLA